MAWTIMATSRTKPVRAEKTKPRAEKVKTPRAEKKPVVDEEDDEDEVHADED